MVRKFLSPIRSAMASILMKSVISRSCSPALLSFCTRSLVDQKHEKPTYVDHENTTPAAAITKTHAAIDKMSKPKHLIEPFDICQHAPLLPESMEEEVTFGNLVPGDDSEVLRPGMVLLKNFIPLDDQVKIVKLCRRLGLGEGGFYQPGVVFGDKRRRILMCLGLDWNVQTGKYEKKRHFDGASPPPVPPSFVSLTDRAIAAAQDLIGADKMVDLIMCKAEDLLPHMRPDSGIINFYTTNGRLLPHQDKNESRKSIRQGLPVVTISLGDSAVFLYGDYYFNDARANTEEVLLESGDVLLFGSCSRSIHHAVKSIIPHSAPAALKQATNLRPGRLSITLRKY